MRIFSRGRFGLILIFFLFEDCAPAAAQNLLCSITSTVTGTNSTACGSLSVVNGNFDVATGFTSSITGNNSSAFGAFSFAGGDNALALGAHATAANGSPYSGASNATAVGAYSTAGINAVALGYMASASASGSVAIGNGSIASVANTVSFGSVGSERKLVNVAAGTLSASSTDAVNGSQLNTTNIAVAANATGLATINTNFTTANQRIAAAFGGGSGIDANGVFTAPSYTIQGSSYSSVGSAFTALDTRVSLNSSDIQSLTSGLTGLIQQDPTTRRLSIGGTTDGTVLDVSGTAGTRKITGVQAGTLSVSSTDAVNGSQLNTTNIAVAANVTGLATINTNFATTNQRLASAFGGGSGIDANGVFTAPNYTIQGSSYSSVGSAFTALDTRVSTNSSDLSLLTSNISTGSIGVVRQDPTTRRLSLGATTDGTVLDVTGTAGARTITGVLRGTISASSTDAVNGSQLAATNDAVALNATGLATINTNFATTNQRLASAFGGGSGIDANGVFTAPNYTIQGSNYSSVGSAFTALDTRVSLNSSDIQSLTSGSIGFVRQDQTTRRISLGGTTDGTVVDVSGTAGARTLTGVLRGTVSASSTDAVNGSQLAATNDAVALNATGLATINTNFATTNQRLASAFGGGAGIDANGVFTAPNYTIQGSSYSNVGSAFTALDTQVSVNTSGLQTLTSQLGNGSIGLVRQDATTRAIGIGNTTDGTLVDVNGTAGARTVTGVRTAALSATSTDAVNGSQLFATNSAVSANAAAITTTNTNLSTTNQRISSVFGGGASIDANGVFTAPAYTIQGSSYSSVGSAFTALDTRVSLNSSDIQSLTSQVGNGSLGLVQQNATTRRITVAGSTNGDTVDLTGTAGTRILTGLQSGNLSSGSTDAVTGAQLFATNAAVMSNTSAISGNTASISTLDTNASVLNQRLASVFGAGAAVDSNGVVTMPSYTVLGSSYSSLSSALSALSSRVDTNSTNISNLMASGGGSGGGPGMVVQNPSTRVIDVATTTDGTTVNVAGTSGPRVITGVAPGSVASGSTDAVNGSQLQDTRTSIANVANSTAAALGGGAVADANGNISAPQFGVQGNTYNSVATAVGALDTAVTAQGVSISNIANTINSSGLRYMSVNGVGSNASSTGVNSIAFGASSASSGLNSIAIGANSIASQAGAIALGGTSAATGVNAIAIGTNARATGSVALGVNTLASNGGAALGDYSTATGPDSAALGPKATATAANAVAIGSGSIANVANTVSVGSVGNERRITNVAPGINQTDAVNVSQLNDFGSRYDSQISRLNDRVDRTAGGVAMAMAMTGSSLPSDKNVGTAVNVGTFGGRSAIAISQYLRLNRNLVVSGAVGIQDNQASGRGGLMLAW